LVESSSAVETAPILSFCSSLVATTPTLPPYSSPESLSCLDSPRLSSRGDRNYFVPNLTLHHHCFLLLLRLHLLHSHCELLNSSAGIVEKEIAEAIVETVEEECWGDGLGT
jgi:hypothetical protein